MRNLLVLAVLILLIAPAAAQNVTRVITPNPVFLGENVTVSLVSDLPCVGVQIIETYPTEAAFINYSCEDVSSCIFNQTNTTLEFIVVDMYADGFTINYELKAPDFEGTYNFSGTYEPMGGNLTTIKGETVLIVSDGVNDSLEQILGKYLDDFDWRTQTPTKEDVVDAVTNAVYEYFNTDDPELRQEIVDDVTQMVNLYFSL